MGGTPVYAGPWTFSDFHKDLFSFGRLAMELFMNKSVWMGLTFYPVEDVTVLQMFRQRLSHFMKAIQKTTTSEYIESHKRATTFDKVINAARSYNGEDQLSAEW